MSDATLPSVRAALVDPGGTTSRPFYTFFQSQATNLSALSERVSAIEATPSGASNLSPNANVIGAYSIAVQGTLRTGIVRVLLEGDVEFAGATNYYGSDSTGAKGWYAISDALADSANIIKSVDADGVTSFDLSDVTVGSGGTLQKYGFDAKGRLNNQSAATTSDLAEGSNLYFTAARVLSTVLAGLSTASSSVITAADSVLSSFGKLQAQISAVVTSLAGYVQTTRTIAAGTGLSGGGDLSANRTVSMGTPSTLTGATTNAATGTTHTHALTLTKSDVGLGNVDNTSDVNKPVSTAQAEAIALKQDISGLGTAAFANTGNNAAGLVPVLDSPGSGQTSLTLAGPSARANLYMRSGNADALNIGEGTVSFAGTGSVSSSTEKRLALIYVNTDGTTANNRGGKFGINIKQDGNTVLVSRLSIGYLGHIEPGVDNAQTMGSSSLRWSVVYAGTGTINTSDAREKTDVSPLTAAELAAAADLARAPGTYQWLAAVQAKGADARKHAGLTVQRAIEIMQAHGLDPFAYGFICYDQWDETPESADTETGEVTQAYIPAGDRYSFRHDELLMFIARGFAARLDALEATLPA